MKILCLDTCSPDLRASVEGWGCEDSYLYVPRKPIGFTPKPKFTHYKTVLQAMADDWRLMGPPVDNSFDRDGIKIPYFTFWLSKDDVLFRQ